MEVATMEMFQSILVIILLAIWLVFSIVFLITAIQNLINDRKREVDKDKRDLEYHEARMKEPSK
jgi:F0F1-type ATP synthase membrane subunit b/b'